MQAGERFFTVDQLYPAALDVILAAVEHCASSRQLIEHTGHGILDELIGRLTTQTGELVN